MTSGPLRVRLSMLPPLVGAGEFLIQKLCAQQNVGMHAHTAPLNSYRRKMWPLSGSPCMSTFGRHKSHSTCAVRLLATLKSSQQ